MPKFSRWDNKIRVTSLDIAQLTQKEHKHVKRDIQNVMLKHGLQILQKNQAEYRDSYKRKQTMLVLDTNITKLLADHYNTKSKQAHDLIIELIAQKRNEHEEHLDRIVDGFMSKFF